MTELHQCVLNAVNQCLFDMALVNLPHEGEVLKHVRSFTSY